jgi:hypothetical protein
VLDFVIRAVPLMGPAVPRAFVGDAQVDEHLRKIPATARPPTKPTATEADHDQKLPSVLARTHRILICRREGVTLSVAVTLRARHSAAVRVSGR